MINKLKEKELVCIGAGIAMVLFPVNLIGYGLIAYGLWNLYSDR